MKKFFLLIIFISSCARQEVLDSKINESMNFNNDYTISQYIIFLESYNDKKGYPDINK
jgi:hypothetical protein